MDEKLTRFLGLVPTAHWYQPPRVWNEQVRQALSDGLITVGFGGLIKLTDAGREAAKLRYRMDGSQQWQS